MKRRNIQKVRGAGIKSISLSVFYVDVQMKKEYVCGHQNQKIIKTE